MILINKEYLEEKNYKLQKMTFKNVTFIDIEYKTIQ